jgi:hypothetical protein
MNAAIEYMAKRWPGAARRGRPRKDPAGLTRVVSVQLTPTQIAAAEQIGGTVQEAIRQLLDSAAARPHK